MQHTATRKKGVRALAVSRRGTSSFLACPSLDFINNFRLFILLSTYIIYAGRKLELTQEANTARFEQIGWRGLGAQHLYQESVLLRQQRLQSDNRPRREPIVGQQKIPVENLSRIPS